MPVPRLEARMSMVDGFPYKEEVGGSSPSVPTIYRSRIGIIVCPEDRQSVVRQGTMDRPNSLFSFDNLV
jgi:hypothetical protein